MGNREEATNTADFPPQALGTNDKADRLAEVSEDRRSDGWNCRMVVDAFSCGRHTPTTEKKRNPER